MLMFYLQMLDTPEEKAKFEEIYLAYRGMMFNIANSILRNEKDAEDAVHNAFLWIIKNFSKFFENPCENLAPLNAIIVRNESITIARKRSRLVPLDDWDGFEDTAAEANSYDELVEVFDQLPQTYRAVMEMKLVLGFTDGEIADRLGLTKTAVSTRINRGRQLLREIVTKEGFVHDR